MTELSALVRFLHLLASVLLAGYFAFDFLVLRRFSGNSPDSQISSDSKKSLAGIVFGCILVAFITHGVGLWLQTALVSESRLAAVDLPAIIALVSHTQYGKVWLGRLIVLLLIAVFYLRPKRAVQRSFPAAFGFVLTSLFLASLALAGHAAATDGLALVMQAGADALHLFAAGVWLGGLVPLAVLLRHCALSPHPAHLTVARQSVRRFSALALVCVSALIVTGAFNSWSLVGGFPQLFGTAYGKLLLGKLALLVPLLALGAVNLLKIKPRLSRTTDASDEPIAAELARLARNLIIEAALGVAILLIVGHMGVTAPARHVQPDWPFSFRWDWTVLDKAPKARAEATRGLVWLAVGIGVLVCALARRQRRILAALIGVAALGYGGFVIQEVVAIDSYPVTYKRPAVTYNAISVANGKELYQNSGCDTCHGASGYGDGPTAQELDPKPADFTAPHANAHTAGDLYWWLSYGVKPSSAMPGFGASLNEEERWDLINYLRALSSGEKARALAPVIEDKPWLVAPDFAYETNDGANKTLKDHRGNKIVLLIVLNLQDTEERLRELSKVNSQLQAAEVEIVVVPNLIDRLFVDKQLPGLIVSEGIREIVETYKLFASSFNSENPIRATPHVEFLIDKQGYIRARWLPADNAGWRKFDLLMQQIDALRKEKPSAPAPDEHVH
jgi:copper resistance protein D